MKCNYISKHSLSTTCHIEQTLYANCLYQSQYVLTGTVTVARIMFSGGAFLPVKEVPLWCLNVKKVNIKSCDDCDFGMFVALKLYKGQTKCLFKVFKLHFLEAF